MDKNNANLYSAIDRVKALTPAQDPDKAPEAPPAAPPSVALELVRRQQEQTPPEPKAKPGSNPAIY